MKTTTLSLGVLATSTTLVTAAPLPTGSLGGVKVVLFEESCKQALEPGPACYAFLHKEERHVATALLPGNVPTKAAAVFSSLPSVAHTTVTMDSPSSPTTTSEMPTMTMRLCIDGVCRGPPVFPQEPRAGRISEMAEGQDAIKAVPVPILPQIQAEDGEATTPILPEMQARDGEAATVTAVEPPTTTLPAIRARDTAPPDTDGDGSPDLSKSQWAEHIFHCWFKTCSDGYMGGEDQF